MKKRFLSLILAGLMILSSAVISVSASEDYSYGYFMAVIKPEFSSDLEKTVSSLSFYNVESIDIISEPDSSQGALVIWLTTDTKEGFDEAYEHFGKEECVDRLIKDVLCGDTEEPTEEEIMKAAYLAPFDTDGDGNVTASDARFVLRAAVGLEELTENQEKALGLKKDEDVSADDARKVLRASVGLEDIPDFIINTEIGKEVSVGGLLCSGGAGYYWEVSGAENKFEVKERSFETAIGKTGGAVRYYYIFTPSEKGGYTITFSYKDARDHKTVEDFTLNINVG